jgi:DNA-binding XRE family transcriptional regulator|tara:strand:- start:273 stop:557 length:285 start_codon:yes stop_codon:yes gene_type:complete
VPEPFLGRGHTVVKSNCVRQIREAKMMSKAELARKASVTVQTIDRIEKGNDCRLDTKRKIILALGYKLVDRTRIFDSENDNSASATKKVKKKNP